MPVQRPRVRQQDFEEHEDGLPEDENHLCEKEGKDEGPRLRRDALAFTKTPYGEAPYGIIRRRQACGEQFCAFLDRLCYKERDIEGIPLRYIPIPTTVRIPGRPPRGYPPPRNLSSRTCACRMSLLKSHFSNSIE